MMSASTHMRCSGVSPRSHERIGFNGSRSSCRRRVCMLSRQRNIGSAAVASASLQPAVAAKTMIGGRMNVRGVTATKNKNAKSVAGGRGRLQVVAARVAGVEIPSKKRLETSLTYIYGIGPTTAKQILGDTGIENKRVFELDDKELATIRSEVEKYTVEGDLRRQVELNIKRLIDIQCYRGRRHQMRLPVRGQRTKTNARTRKGKSSPVAGKKK